MQTAQTELTPSVTSNQRMHSSVSPEQGGHGDFVHASGPGLTTDACQLQLAVRMRSESCLLSAYVPIGFGVPHNG